MPAKFRPTIIALAAGQMVVATVGLVIVGLIAGLSGPEKVPSGLWAVITGCITPISGYVAALLAQPRHTEE